MFRNLFTGCLIVVILMSTSTGPLGARGFGGGGGRGFGGAGGFSAAGRGAGGYHGVGGNSFGGMGGFGGEKFGAAGRGSGGYGGLGSNGFGGAGGFGAGGLGAAGFADRGTLGGVGYGAQGFGADRFSTPSRSQLSGFLGLPSDEGLRGLGADSGNAGNRSFGDSVNFNWGTATGPRGGEAAGVTATGPRGNTVGRAAGIGADGGAATVSGVKGANGGEAARGAAVGPGGQVFAREAARGPNGGAAVRSITYGPRGAAAGFARVTPARRYTTAAAVRGNYDHWGLYGSGWYARYPGAWVAAGWAANEAWNACNWDTAAAFCGSYDQPVYYDYGNNVTYQDNSVYIDGQDVGTSEEYYNQAAQLATTGAEAEAPSAGDWLPLGVFSFTKPDQPSSNLVVQLAVNKDGVLRGNYTDTTSNQTQPIQGSVDKTTQRVAFTVGNNTTNVVETGLYNLTKDEAPALLHFGKDRTEQWLLVRLKQDAADGAAQKE